MVQKLMTNFRWKSGDKKNLKNHSFPKKYIHKNVLSAFVYNFELRKLFFLFSFYFIFHNEANSQAVLSLKDAIKIGVENNFDIRIAKNDAAFAIENNTYGNAGFLPTVGFTANRNFQWKNNCFRIYKNLIFILFQIAFRFKMNGFNDKCMSVLQLELARSGYFLMNV
jgi:hypothetical protein